MSSLFCSCFSFQYRKKDLKNLLVALNLQIRFGKSSLQINIPISTKILKNSSPQLLHNFSQHLNKENFRGQRNEKISRLSNNHDMTISRSWIFAFPAPRLIIPNCRIENAANEGREKRLEGKKREKKRKDRKAGREGSKRESQRNPSGFSRDSWRIQRELSGSHRARWKREGKRGSIIKRRPRRRTKRGRGGGRVGARETRRPSG